MRIAHITNVIDGRFNSGTARVARETIINLSRISDIEQILIHFDSSSDQIYGTHNSKEILLHPKWPLPGRRFLAFLNLGIKLRFSIIRGKTSPFDVCHWHTSRVYPFHFLLPAKKHILNIHDAGIFILPEAKSFSNSVFKFWIRISYRSFSSIIVVSNVAKNSLLRYCKKMAEKIRVVYPGTNFDLLNPILPSNYPKKLINSQFLICVSRWQKYKNVEMLITTYANLNSQLRAKFPLLIIGRKISTNDKIEKIINSLLKEGSLYLFRDLRDQEIAAYFDRAYLHIYPSLHEGFGLSVIEGMSRGCPALVDINTATFEIVGKSGFSVDMRNSFELGNRIVQITSNPVVRNQFSTLAKERAKSFSWSNYTESLLALYSDNAIPTGG